MPGPSDFGMFGCFEDFPAGKAPADAGDARDGAATLRGRP